MRALPINPNGNLNLDQTLSTIIRDREDNPVRQLDVINIWLERVERRIDRPWDTEMGCHAKAMVNELEAIRAQLFTVRRNITSKLPARMHSMVRAAEHGGEAQAMLRWTEKTLRLIATDRYQPGTIGRLKQAHAYLADASECLKTMWECAR